MNSFSSVNSILNVSSSSGVTPNVGGERFVFLFNSANPSANSATGYTNETASTGYLNGVFIQNSSEYLNNPNSLNLIQGPNGNQGSGYVFYLTPAFNMSSATGFTFSCWLKIIGTIYNANAADTSRGYPLFFGYNNLLGGDLGFYLYIRDTGGNVGFFTSTGVTSGSGTSVNNCENFLSSVSYTPFINWANIIYTITNVGGGAGEIKLYVNNSLIATGGTRCDFSQNIRRLTAFNFTAGTNGQQVSGLGILSYGAFIQNKTYPALNGYIDNVRIFLRSITDSERASIYNNRL